ncbi:MAG: hypothetical protein ACPGSO_01525 [Vicingaceae bacterium]
MNTTNVKREGAVNLNGYTKNYLSNNSSLVKLMMMQRTRCLGMC